MNDQHGVPGALPDGTELDAGDPLRAFAERFHRPAAAGRPSLYLCGHSLGLQPRGARELVDQALGQWAELGVDGHFAGERPWVSYAETLKNDLALLTGAGPGEVVAMNSLTVNLHLMLASFYRPAGRRERIVIEKHAFPSDRYAVASQLHWHGRDADRCLVELEDRPGAATLSTATLAAYLEEHGDEVALLLLPGVQYLSGALQDMPGACALARRHGIPIGFDLAHAIGNVPLALHEWGADFAVWCSYKYLNGGPGAVGGCFVHARHEAAGERPRLAGWWGNDPASRFRMAPGFSPARGADGWQLSNPPILALAPLLASLALFREAGMDRLRAKSRQLTGFLESLLLQRLGDAIELLTPRDPDQRGCQLSLRLRLPADRARAAFERLREDRVVADWREPDVIRVAPVPLYNSFLDCRRFVERLAACLHAPRR